MNLNDVPIGDLALVFMHRLQTQDSINELSRETLSNIMSACESEIMNRQMAELPFLLEHDESVYCYD